ncbi:DNA-binding domain-containing protein [Pseudohoeflea coraliihabitans]|uniref:DNA-binding domain-containing protein n=1 Tax=Pseudohoeflea coraliihabitans TaxID=2860393 RepID=A0ABS6WK75_9HYPH|nr:DNA-binding domain-containing protein [Pseudohoeflea sp. DP4N28-3]MBW3096346.1 DNA-binding domain-containing protein [Pseudohoeflea sp. DP4N28-3]
MANLKTRHPHKPNDREPAAQEIFQDGFARALRQPDAPLPPGLIGPHGKAAVKRFAVYRNNVTVSLINAVAEIFPAIHDLLGETAFNDIARLYLRAEPPRSPLLHRYGETFPAFLNALPALSRYPFLPDLARLERAWLTAFHAADAAPLEPSLLQALPPDTLAERRFAPHPATALIASDYAICTLFTKCRGQQPLDGVQLATPEAVLLSRPGSSVMVHRLSPGEHTFFAMLLDGETLAAAADAAAAAAPSFDLAAAISTLLASGAFISAAAGKSAGRAADDGTKARDRGDTRPAKEAACDISSTI